MADAGLDDRSVSIKEADIRSYAKSSGDFARLTERYSDAVADHMLILAGSRPGASLLDIGTGSGLVAVKAAIQQPELHATGIDQSQEMLEQARARAKSKGVDTQTTFRSMDAENLDLQDGTIDLVTSLYVLRHLPNPAKAVAEAYRVLRTGGRAVIAVGAPPALLSSDGMRAAIDKLQDRVLESLGRRAVSPAALRKFLDRQGIGPAASHAAHHGAGDVADMYRTAGFTHVRMHWFGQSFALLPEEFWEVQAVFDSEARSRIEPLDPARIAELREEFLTECRVITRRGGKLLYRTGAEIHVADR